MATKKTLKKKKEEYPVVIDPPIKTAGSNDEPMFESINLNKNGLQKAISLISQGHVTFLEAFESSSKNV